MNLASRIAAVAEPGAVVVTEALRDAAGDGHAFAGAGRHRLKGVSAEVTLLRAGR